MVYHLLRPPSPALRLNSRSLIGGIAIAASVFASFPAVAAADSGRATWYGPGFQGNVMYNGHIYNMYDPTTTACNIFPMGTWLKVSNPANGQSVVVQVRDRGAFPWAFDLSYAAFKTIANPAVMMIGVTYQVVSGPGGQPDVAPSAKPQLVSTSLLGPPTSTTKYVVQPGDTLSGIASGFKIPLSTLAQWNAIADPDSLLQGQTLRLTAPPAAAPVEPATSTYKVKLGDTLIGIASQYGLSAEQIASANNLSEPSLIVEGQTLVIPVATGSSKDRQYEVQPGDTVIGIAAALGVSPTSLQAQNQIDDPLTIQPGQVLRVPAS